MQKTDPEVHERVINFPIQIIQTFAAATGLSADRKPIPPRSEPIPEENPTSGSITTPKKKAKVEVKKDVIDLTNDPDFIDSAEEYDENWKSSKPASPKQKSNSTSSKMPELKCKFIKPTGSNNIKTCSKRIRNL